MDNNVVAKHILDVAVGLEKKSKTELITELSDIFDNASKIDLNSKENIASLKNLAKAFETIFTKAGNKSINFADLIEMPPPAMFAEMGKIAATSFWDAWNSVSGGAKFGISQDVLKEELNQLKKQRAELVKKQKTLPIKQDKLDSLSDILYAEQDEFHVFSKDELKKFGKSVDDVALDMTDALSRTMDELGNLKGGTQEFEAALERAYEQLNDVFRMSRTLAKQPDLVSDKTILADYDFDLLQEDYVESLMDYENAFTNMMFSIKNELDNIPVKLKEIDDKILQIQNSGIELVDQTEAKNGLKTLNEIEEAYKNILTHDKKRAARPDQKKVGKIEKSLAFDPSASNQGIQTLYNQYLEAQSSGVWEEEYQALLKYVKLYEEYLRSENKTHRNKVTRADNPFTPLYEQLKPMADNARNALQNIVNMAKDQPLVGMGGSDEGSGMGTGNSSDDAANAEKIAEAKRIAAEKEAEAAGAAKQKRIEEEKAAKAAEKKRLADEASAEAQRKAAEEAERERLAKEASANAGQSGNTNSGNIQVVLEDMNKFLSSNKDKKVEDYFELIAAGAYEMSDDVKSAIEATIGSIDTLHSINIGANNRGGLIGDKSALILRKPHFDRDKQKWDTDKQNNDAIELQNRLNSTNTPDVNLGKIQEVIKAEEYLVELQNRVSGAPISTIGEAIEDINPDVLNVTEAAVQSLIQAMRELYNIGVEVDTQNLGNILYDGQTDRFGIVDMDVKHDFESFEEMISAFAQTVRYQVEDIVDILNNPDMAQAWSRFADMVDSEVAKANSIVPAADGLNSSVGDASSAEVEAERAKREALQDEIEQKNQELARIQQENDEKLKSANDEKATLQNDLDATRQQLVDSEYEKGLYDSAMNQLTEESNEKDRIIYDLREQLANVKTGGDEETASVGADELKRMLGEIIYKVKFTHDEQGESDSKNEPWALEKTLQTVKGVLDNIQTNTAKPESVEVATAKTDVGNVLATESTLAAIKTTVEAINKKVIQGTKAATFKSQKETAAPQSKKKNAADTKELIKDYTKLGKLRAQFEKDGNLETRATLKNLAAEVGRKRETLQLTSDEIIELRKKSDIAYKAEKLLLDAAEAQKKTDDAQKAADKDTKKRAVNAKKMAQREAMLGKAGNAVGRAENTWMSAVGIEGELPAGFAAEIDEYYQQLDALRKKHQELKNSDMISEEQKKELVAQTMSVNKMTEEIGELVSEYQRLSGDNATVIGTNALNSGAGLDAYKQQLKQAVMAATSGAAQIKGFDAATKTLTYTVKTGKNEFTEYTAAVRRADGALVSLQGATKRTETFFEATKRKMRELTSYFSGMAVFGFLKQELVRGIKYVREIDSALTELKKVTNETEETYDKFLNTASKTAAKVGSTIKEVVSSTADWARLNI